MFVLEMYRKINALCHGLRGCDAVNEPQLTAATTATVFLLSMHHEKFSMRKLAKRFLRQALNPVVNLSIR